MIKFTCPRCEKLLEHSEPEVEVDCPECGQKIIVPSPMPVAERPEQISRRNAKQRNLVIFAVVGAVVLLFVILIGGTLLVVGVGFIVGRTIPSSVNACCPVCGEEFHIDYHEGHTAQSLQNHKCPNCGSRLPEIMFANAYDKARQPPSTEPIGINIP